MRNIHAVKAIRRAAVALLAAVAVLVPAPLSTAAGTDPGHGRSVITLPGATGAEGIAAGEGSTFFAGDRLNGNIYRGDIRDGTARKFITAPAGRAAIGMKVDRRHDLLFVAGGSTGQAYLYDLKSRKTEAMYQLAAPGTSFINDVTLTSRGAWFTNSQAGELYFVPVGSDGEPGTARTLKLKGPAGTVDQGFNLNGIAAAGDGDTLIVAHTARGVLYTVNARTGASAEIGGVSVPNVDGILLKDGTLWAVQNLDNQVSRIRLDSSLDSGELRHVITSPNFDIPTTAALFDDTLAVVNSKFTNPGATSFEVVRVQAR